MDVVTRTRRQQFPEQAREYLLLTVDEAALEQHVVARTVAQPFALAGLVATAVSDDLAKNTADLSSCASPD